MGHGGQLLLDQVLMLPASLGTEFKAVQAGIRDRSTRGAAAPTGSEMLTLMVRVVQPLAEIDGPKDPIDLTRELLMLLMLVIHPAMPMLSKSRMMRRIDERRRGMTIRRLCRLGHRGILRRPSGPMVVEEKGVHVSCGRFEGTRVLRESGGEEGHQILFLFLPWELVVVAGVGVGRMGYGSRDDGRIDRRCGGEEISLSACGGSGVLVGRGAGGGGSGEGSRVRNRVGLILFLVGFMILLLFCLFAIPTLDVDIPLPAGLMTAWQRTNVGSRRRGQGVERGERR